MRYIKHYLEDITGVEIYPLISLLIFFFFFLALAAYVLFMKKQHADYMSSRPLDESQDESESANLKVGGLS